MNTEVKNFKNQTLAPIVLFVYNRPDHTKQTIEALRKNELAKDSQLFIYSDGFKNELDKEEVLKVRKYLKIIKGFKEIKIIERKQNLGLANSIINGVTEIINTYGKVIVLEDDLITSPYFLKFMNEGLDQYQNKEQVISICGYIYPVGEKLPDTFFIKGADCWGWATWKRGWNLFEKDGKKLLKELETKKLTNEFDFNGTYKYTRMLKNQIKGKNSSWAIRWYASAFLADKLTLYPGRSLVFHNGADGSGTHCGKLSKIFDVILSTCPLKINKIKIQENKKIRKMIENYFNSVKMNFFSKVFKVISLYLKRIIKNKKSV